MSACGASQSSAYSSLPFGAIPITLSSRGYQMATPGAVRQSDVYNSKSYLNFTRAQTFPQQVTFSGYDNICKDCAPNSYAITVPQQPITQALLPNIPVGMMPGRAIAMSNSPLMPVTPRQNYATYTGCTKSRMPRLDLLYFA
jgi:hypothetical protein